MQCSSSEMHCKWILLTFHVLFIICLFTSFSEGFSFLAISWLYHPQNIVVEYLDENNKLIKKEVSGVESRILQHEIDHLSGKLFVDYLSSLKRNIMIKKVQKFLKNKKL